MALTTFEGLSGFTGRISSHPVRKADGASPSGPCCTAASATTPAPQADCTRTVSFNKAQARHAPTRWSARDPPLHRLRCTRCRRRPHQRVHRSGWSRPRSAVPRGSIRRRHHPASVKPHLRPSPRPRGCPPPLGFTLRRNRCPGVLATDHERPGWRPTSMLRAASNSPPARRHG